MMDFDFVLLVNRKDMLFVRRSFTLARTQKPGL
jgi:hypothetical protein